MKLEYFINDCKGLDFEARQEEYCQSKKQTRIKNKLIDFVRTTGKSPEDIVLEQERLNNIIKLIKRIKKHLGDDYRIFHMIIIQGFKQSYVAKRTGLSQSEISRIYNKSLNKVRDKFKNIAGSLLYQDYIDALTPYSSVREASEAKTKIRYPSEFLSNLSVGGRKGKRVWINHTKCATLDYLDDCFKDNRTCCTYCEKCKNKKALERGRKINE